MTDHEIDDFIVTEERKLRRNFCREEFGLAYLLKPDKGMEPYHRQKNVWLWESALKNIWGDALLPSARHLWMAVRNIYVLDPAGELLPLHQAIRLLDIYRNLQAQLAASETRLAGRPPSPKAHDSATENLGSPKAVRDELKNSCARLEAIIGDVQSALRERRRRDAPGRVRAIGESLLPANVEAQIGREIEKHLFALNSHD